MTMSNRNHPETGASLTPIPLTAVMEKPAGSTWTDDQWLAIAARGRNTLVAAAAGSGKTAVLVERIIRRVSDEADPVDVDRLLVATFTKAAAAEMRERIREALEKALLTRPDSDHLRRQLALLGRASITTLHSFCLEVVQRHIQTLPLDPGFRIANDTEAELLRQDALEEVLEACYTEAPEDHPFWQLAEWFSGSRQDDGLLTAMVLQLYEASRSHPEPERWLQEQAEAFARKEELGDGHPAIRSLLEDVRLELDGVYAMLREAVRLCDSPGGPAHYTPTLQDDLALAGQLREQAAQGWATLHQAFQTVRFGSLKASRKEDGDKAVLEQVKKLRDTVKSRLQKLQEELFVRGLAQYAEELGQAAPLMRTLVELVLRFADSFAAAKQDKAAVDFSDLEHFALKVLRDPVCEPGEWRPSPAALEYREQFAEILLDEYQDTNEVQETIVGLIAKAGAGNRFLVGDVKQSIYRFRLAEPGLFLHKYKTYGKDGTGGGLRIDLARNFRSRREVVDSVNFLFRQLMDETVGEVDYDEAASLVYGAGYPGLPEKDDDNRCATDFVLIDRMPTDAAEEAGAIRLEEAEEGDDAEGKDNEEDETAELETARLEARLIGLRIQAMMDPEEPFQVFDKKTGGYRPAGFRDFVILLRATRAWAPAIVEELKRLGIPAYAELSTGYFEATEVETMMSLLRVIDNPLQDIPLAAVLRSPVVGLNAEQLAQLRLRRRQGSFAEAVLSLLESPEDSGVSGESEEWLPGVRRFLIKMESWRREARQGALSELIWRLYRETGYYDFVGGMPGGLQRQANLRALYDRARQYEATTLRGLYRFLRFMERMRDSGEDLGTARALGEQEDVVRIMTIHKSKGLEFPVVFVAGMAKRFNLLDLNGSFLLHKELGFGPKFVDTALRVSYPMLPHLAIRRRIRKETLAEELRILYVALTRAREKLILVGTVNDGPKRLTDWGRGMSGEDERLPAYERAQANSYLDWVAPAVLRHPQAEPLRRAAGLPAPRVRFADEPSRFRLEVVHTGQLHVSPEELAPDGERDRIRASLLALQPVAAAPGFDAEVEARLAWRYSHPYASRLYSKTTVTEMKRQAAATLVTDDPEYTPFPHGARAIVRRPQFLQDRQLTAAERGTAYHAVMQFIPLQPGLAIDEVGRAIGAMRERRLLTETQAEAIDPQVIACFFAGEAGRLLLQARRVQRELPFSYGLRAGELEAGISDPVVAGETVLIQGVIDCLFETDAGWVLLDYKTDATEGLSDGELRERYRLQLSLYARAIQEIWRRPLRQKLLYFFDGSRLITVE